ncbi:P-type conjugative transfer protein TrbG [Roseobacter litoralis]|uniref:P-type conjugative transfer protein TrbG n=1 Tax=Roseobacter litoralis TaxID=42443 RepID=UPI0024957598|nr:P-type conjugative transfer protein TrbG [Roseobacter litoralis]
MINVNSTISITLTACLLLSACASYTPSEIDYDGDVPDLPAPPPPVVEEPVRAIHTPPPWTPSRGGEADAATAEARVINANAAARVEPRREGYYNAIQVFPYSEGALYQIYAAPGQITNIALEPGEQLTGAGPIAAGDTTRWIIGDTESGNALTARVHILVKPTRPDISTNLVINTDRRTYLLELHANETSYMASVAWSYPPARAQPRPPAIQQPTIPPASHRNYRYGLQVEENTPPWRPDSVFDDGRRVYVVFPRGIVQGEMPPLFVLGADGSAELVNTRVFRNVLIVDRLFAAAELRLGSDDQQVVRIVRTDGRPRP